MVGFKINKCRAQISTREALEFVVWALNLMPNSNLRCRLLDLQLPLLFEILGLHQCCRTTEQATFPSLIDKCTSLRVVLQGHTAMSCMHLVCHLHLRCLSCARETCFRFGGKKQPFPDACNEQGGDL